MTDLPTAIQQASLWRVEACPVVKAVVGLNQILIELFGEGSSADGAYAAIGEAYKTCIGELVLMREWAIERHVGRVPMPDPTGTGYSEWCQAFDAWERFNEELNRSVPTVDQVIRDVERE